MIRVATRDDIAAIVDLMHVAYARSRFVGIGEIDRPLAEKLWAQLILRHAGRSAGSSCALVSISGGKVTGFFAAVLSRIYSVGTKLNATDQFFYVGDDGDPHDWSLLVDGYTLWAESCPDVAQIRLTNNDAFSDPDLVAKLYARKGFVPCGGIYQRRQAA